MSEKDAKHLEGLIDDLFYHVTRHKRRRRCIGDFLDESVELWSANRSKHTVRNLLVSEQCFYDFTPPSLELFYGSDFPNALDLLKRLESATDVVATVVWKQISPAMRDLMRTEALKPSQLKEPHHVLADIFNTIAHGPCLYNVEHFSRTILREETRALLKSKPTGASLVRLNVLLLEDAFRSQLKRGLKWKEFSVLTPSLYKAYFEHVKRFCPGSLAMRYGFHMRFINRAMHENLLKVNPLKSDEILAIRKMPKPKREPGFTDEELRLTYEYLDKMIPTAPELPERGKLTKRILKDFRGIMIIEEGSGARLNDVLALRLSNINRETKKLCFEDHKTHKYHELDVLEPLWDHINSMEPSDDPDPPLFMSWYVPPGEGAKHLTNRIRQIFVAAGVRKPGRLVTTRCFRRRVASELSKVDPVAARDVLGHSSLDITNIYVVGTQKNVDEGCAILKSKAVVAHKVPFQTPAHEQPVNQSQIDPHAQEAARTTAP